MMVACTARDVFFEAEISERLMQFKNSNADAMDLSYVLGKNWRRVCLQSVYTVDEDSFYKYSGEKINHVLHLALGQYGLWVFYNDGSVKAAKINVNVMGFVSTEWVKDSTLCTSINNPYIYAFEVSGVRRFYFSDH
jgi:hypothetical protein